MTAGATKAHAPATPTERPRPMKMQPGWAQPRTEEATTSPGANADGGGCNDEERTRSRGPKQASPERKKRLLDEPSYDSTIAGAAEKSVAVPSSAKRRDTLERELEAVYGGMGDVFSDSTVVASPLAKSASEMDLELEIAYGQMDDFQWRPTGEGSFNEDPSSNAHSEPKAQASSLTGAARAEPSEERTNDTRGKESSKATAKQTIFL